MNRLNVRALDPQGNPDGHTIQVSGNKFIIGPPPAAGITVQDENGNIATGVTQLDFQGAGVTATAGTGEVVVTIPGGTTGGGTAAQSYVGAAAPGSSMAAFVSQRVYLKKVTLANAALMSDIEAYVDGAAAAGQVDSFAVALFSDKAGSPASILAANMLNAQSLLLDPSNNNSAADSPPRWLSLAIGRWLAAGDYWLAVSILTDTAIGTRLGVDTTGGSDRYYTSGGAWLSDAGFYALTTTTNSYSIRANLITL